METSEEGLAKFCHLLQSFHSDRVPSDLFIRACEAKITWSSAGKIILKQPLEARVPEWLVNFYNSNKSLFYNREQQLSEGYLRVTVENGVIYLKAMDDARATPEHNLHTLVSDEETLAQERIAIALQAIPSINSEIIGDQSLNILMDTINTSILPLLSSVTDDDIRRWLWPKGLNDRKEWFFSLLEFLYQAANELGIDHPSIPFTLPSRILNNISGMTVDNCATLYTAIAKTQGRFSSSCHKGTESYLLPPQVDTDERSNAMLAYILSMLVSHEATIAGAGVLNDSLTGILSNWGPLSRRYPSPMEFLAATSLCTQSQLHLAGRPGFDTIDTLALYGFLLSKRKRYDEAVAILGATTTSITMRYGRTSMQLAIVTAEMANCYNILRQEAEAHDCAIELLEALQDPGLSTRRDVIYLKIALADSFIGRARYSEAVPILESIINNPDIAAIFRMMSVLRIARSRRRMHEKAQQAFELDSPLWTGLALLSCVSVVLQMEYVEELACNVSEMSHKNVAELKQAKGLIRAVDKILGDQCTSATANSSWEWYLKVQQEYLTETENKGKEKDDLVSCAKASAVVDPAPGRDAPQLPLRGLVDLSEDEGPWSERLVLSFDGGGVRALSSLLILHDIMRRIRDLEVNHPDGPAYSSSSYPWMKKPPKLSYNPDRLDEFLPCHYFDYMAGVSAGGLSAIMLGRLRMSVDEAIQRCIDLGPRVFGQPKLFHQRSSLFYPPTRYSAVKASEAFKGLITIYPLASKAQSSVLHRESLNADEELFMHKGRGTRTMTISWRVEEDTGSEYLWRDYSSSDTGTTRTLPSNHVATICQVAYATTASPLDFDAIEVGNDTFLDGGVAISNPSYAALQEISALHTNPPTVFVSLGTGQIGLPYRRVSGSKRFSRQSQKKSRLLNLTARETKQWLELATRLGMEQTYRLDAEGELSSISFDDWLLDGTKTVTLGQIKEATDKYLDTPAAKNSIDHIAREAVRIRRARAHTERWEAFAMDLNYVCVLCIKASLKRDYDLRADLRAHLEEKHADWHMSDLEVEKYLDAGRRLRGMDDLAWF